MPSSFRRLPPCSRKEAPLGDWGLQFTEGMRNVLSKGRYAPSFTGMESTFHAIYFPSTRVITSFTVRSSIVSVPRSGGVHGEYPCQQSRR